jgi:hypothetical protein
MAVSVAGNPTVRMIPACIQRQRQGRECDVLSEALTVCCGAMTLGVNLLGRSLQTDVLHPELWLRVAMEGDRRSPSYHRP